LVDPLAPVLSKQPQPAETGVQSKRGWKRKRLEKEEVERKTEESEPV
jgi:hypothetical protein